MAQLSSHRLLHGCPHEGSGNKEGFLEDVHLGLVVKELCKNDTFGTKGSNRTESLWCLFLHGYDNIVLNIGVTKKLEFIGRDIVGDIVQKYVEEGIIRGNNSALKEEDSIDIAAGDDNIKASYALDVSEDTDARIIIGLCKKFCDGSICMRVTG